MWRSTSEGRNPGRVPGRDPENSLAILHFGVNFW
jgi:hypothetical protein